MNTAEDILRGRSAEMKPGLGIRKHFPIFQDYSSDKPLSYLDSAASSQKPTQVIECLSDYFLHHHANIHRGAYKLSADATNMYEAARSTVASFLNVHDSRSIVFTKNATEAINLVANAYSSCLKPNDVVLLTELEHHSNIVPWQLVAERCGFRVEFVGLNSDATINQEELAQKLLKFKPKMLAITAQSNAFGTVTPLDKIIPLAQAQGTKVLVDASQYVVHAKTDIATLNPDFLVFTGHKLYGPTGIGVLYGKLDLLEQMDPYQGGGDMIEQVTITGSSWAKVPSKFEAGTPPIAEAIALGQAIEFMQNVGVENIEAHESKLFVEAFNLLKQHSAVDLYGPALNGGAQRSILSFNVKGVHPHDFSTIADEFNVQVRAGHHCAMPAMKSMGIHSTIRASLGIYSDISDFERLLLAVDKAASIFS